MGFKKNYGWGDKTASLIRLRPHPPRFKIFNFDFFHDIIETRTRTRTRTRTHAHARTHARTHGIYKYPGFCLCDFYAQSRRHTAGYHTAGYHAVTRPATTRCHAATLPPQKNRRRQKCYYWALRAYPIALCLNT